MPFVEPYTCGYVKEDGSLFYCREYHGDTSDKEIRNEGLPEFSETHWTEDTCVRLYKEPNIKQYQALEKIIDDYLNREEYCKIEIWTNPQKNRDYTFYKIFSLYEGACDDTSFEEIVGNWSGYKLVKIIKDYFKKELKEDLIIRDKRKNRLEEDDEIDYNIDDNIDTFEGPEVEEDDTFEDENIIKNEEILSTLYKMTHIKNINGNDASYCFLEEISNIYGLDEDTIKDIALKNGYKLMKVSPGETIDGGILIADKNCSAQHIKTDYQKFYGTEVEVEEYKGE